MEKHPKKLSKTERRVRTCINQSLYTSPVIIQIKLSLSKYQVQQSLDSLYLRGEIARPVKGLVVGIKSSKYTPVLKEHIEASIKTEVR